MYKGNSRSKNNVFKIISNIIKYKLKNNRSTKEKLIKLTNKNYLMSNVIRILCKSSFSQTLLLK